MPRSSSTFLGAALCVVSAPMLLVVNVGRVVEAFGEVASSGRWGKTTATALHYSSPSSPSGNNQNNRDDDLLFPEQWWLPPTPQSPQRQHRLAQEEALSNTYDTASLQQLRADVAVLRENLKWARATRDDDRIFDLELAIARGEARDPELVYAKRTQQIAAYNTNDNANKHKMISHEEMEEWKEEAVAARKCIPRFNLEGLWVGNYGDDNGLEMINVTYVGDFLYATKVSGDNNVPRGEVSFRADLSPKEWTGTSDDSSSPSGNDDAAAAAANPVSKPLLQPIELPKEAAQKWGIQSLTRFPGEGQVAAAGFKKNRFVDGQLVLMDHGNTHPDATTHHEDCFSFVWVPTKHHVFFARPSPQVVLHMLRDTLSKEDTLDNMRDHATQCWNVPFCSKAPPLTSDTRRTARHNHVTTNDGRRSGITTEPFQRIKSTRDLQRMDTPPSSPKSQENRFSFWQVKKWKSFIDKALSDDKEQK